MTVRTFEKLYKINDLLDGGNQFYDRSDGVCTLKDIGRDVNLQ